MPSINLRVKQSDWTALRKQLSRSFRGTTPPETGAIGLLGSSLTDDRHDLILTAIIWPEEGDIKYAAHGALTFDSRYLRRAHVRMRELGLHGLATFHTHPLSDDRVCFSTFDTREDPELIQNLQEIEPATSLLSVVLGRRSQQARYWNSPIAYSAVNELTLVGGSITVLPLSGGPPPVLPEPAALFDRSLAITGSGALARLQTMKIGIVGASGTGSLLAELLVRAGCQRLLIIDDDLTEFINLNRILHSSRGDAEVGTPKVAVLKLALERLGLRCQIEAVRANVLDEAVLAKLRSADVIFGCVDRALPRRTLSRFAFQYLIPYIDVGSEIGGDGKGIVSVDARTSYIAPGYPCLMCSGVVTPRTLGLESLVWEEQQRQIALGYCDDLLVKQPAVMDLNMRAASTGMMYLRHLLQQFLLEPLPATLLENIVTYTMRPLISPRTPDPNCRTCKRNKQEGFGDCAPSPGLRADLVARITAPRAGRSN
jgi:molybdopterin/thiamine biosynthesis adenylyltransferase